MERDAASSAARQDAGGDLSGARAAPRLGIIALVPLVGSCAEREQSIRLVMANARVPVIVFTSVQKTGYDTTRDGTELTQCAT